MALKTGSPATNGHANRKCHSWIESFVEFTDGIPSPEIFRRWVAIGIISACLEQKVWIETSNFLWPNLYIWIISPPGIGKSQAVIAGREFLDAIPEPPFIAPTSVTSASLVDFVINAKRDIGRHGEEMLSYNSALMLPDELSAFMHEYDQGMIGILTTMYDVIVPYGQDRRGKDLKLRVKRPQLSMICGTTPSNLMKYMPEYAWDQGFTSRIILLYANKGPEIEDVFARGKKKPTEDMVHDLRCINTLIGRFIIDEPYRECLRAWRAARFPPVPSHPRLEHYNTRRFSHILKLSMVSSVDRGDSLTLKEEDFNRACEWLFTAEATIPAIFEKGISTIDTRAHEELKHFIEQQSGDIKEDRLVRQALKLFPTHAVSRAIEMCERSGMIRSVGLNEKTGLRTYRRVQ